MKERNDLPQELRKWLLGSGRIVIAGIGNPIRTDDLVGVRVVRDLQGKVSEDVVLVECETIPETYLQEIVELEPSHVLLIDAAILGLDPGEARLIEPEQITDFPAITTHVLPLRIFCEYITKATKAKIGLLLIQPKSTEFGEGLTSEVEVSAERIISLLIDILGTKA